MNWQGFRADIVIIFLGAAPVALVIGLFLRAIGNMARDEHRRNGCAVLSAWITLLLWGILAIIGVTG